MTANEKRAARIYSDKRARDAPKTRLFIDFSAITHLIHFALVPKTDGTLGDGANQLDLAHSQEAVTQAHRAGKPVLVSVAGSGAAAKTSTAEPR